MTITTAEELLEATVSAIAEHVKDYDPDGDPNFEDLKLTAPIYLESTGGEEPHVSLFMWFSMGYWEGQGRALGRVGRVLATFGDELQGIVEDEEEVS